MILYIGIDPGKSGGIAMLSGDGEILSLSKTPVFTSSKSRPEYDLQRMRESLAALVPQGNDKILAVLEQLHALPPKLMPGAQAQFHRGYGYGIWQGILVGLKIPYLATPAQQWHKVMFLGEPKGDTKITSIRIAARLWPEQDWRRSSRSKKPDDGLTDAALLAEFGRRTDCGRTPSAPVLESPVDSVTERA